MLLAVLALGGCATTSDVALSSGEVERLFDERQAALAALEDWTAFGRLALETSTQSLQAKVQWKQLQEQYRIRVSGPFGRGAFQLEGRPGRVELRNAKNQTAYARRPEDLLQEQVGWSVPMSGLRHWLLGRPEPGTEVAARELDAVGRLSSLQQAGWTIRYLRYGQFGAWQLPTKVFLENAKVSARFVLSRWQV